MTGEWQKPAPRRKAEYARELAMEYLAEVARHPGSHALADVFSFGDANAPAVRGLKVYTLVAPAGIIDGVDAALCGFFAELGTEVEG